LRQAGSNNDDDDDDDNKHQLMKEKFPTFKHEPDVVLENNQV
jgi:hypothetical protein